MMRYLYKNNLAHFGAPSVSNLADTSMTVSGTIEYFKDGEVGVAYKTGAATSWTRSKSTSTNVSKNITGLTAGTAYKVCFYVKDVTGAYQYSVPVDVTTLQES